MSEHILQVQEQCTTTKETTWEEWLESLRKKYEGKNFSAALATYATEERHDEDVYNQKSAPKSYQFGSALETYPRSHDLEWFEAFDRYCSGHDSFFADALSCVNLDELESEPGEVLNPFDIDALISKLHEHYPDLRITRFKLLFALLGMSDPSYTIDIWAIRKHLLYIPRAKYAGSQLETYSHICHEFGHYAETRLDGITSIALGRAAQTELISSLYALHSLEQLYVLARDKQNYQLCEDIMLYAYDEFNRYSVITGRKKPKD